MKKIPVPFEIQRAYYLYDVPAGSERGGHAHKDLHQLIIAMAGSFEVEIDDGQKNELFTEQTIRFVHMPHDMETTR